MKRSAQVFWSSIAKNLTFVVNTKVERGTDLRVHTASISIRSQYIATE
jgi:hypothetical protein